MQSLRRLATLTAKRSKPPTNSKYYLSTKPTKNGDDEWNDAWETAWLPETLTPKNRDPWETDVNFSATTADSNLVLSPEVDTETKIFVEEMNENWNERRKTTKNKDNVKQKESSELYSLENLKKDYRLKKQRIHAGLWVKEIEKQHEAKLGGSSTGDEIDRLLDSCSDIFDAANNDLDNSRVPISSEFKSKPDGWETTSKAQDGNIWEMSQREEDILLQEFDRRIAYSKFQIASFIKSHIFSRRRPIDGWKYMIEELGPNARRGKGSVSRIQSLSDPATQPFKEERSAATGNFMPPKRRQFTS
ncbi:protein GAMETE CELL DEFECTIVE 1, mitochondrial [Mercurialis annua]|uniref:protein GAMETE CELL DEFECTIVE 1, mitochondrial n=1 Tax=Mercurialis annua TaxID=3986 RepID=UPI0021603316|nr:protein GAMETE CELL DEFECTIVE 1, mitochondrial [Mercurialis annua]